MSTRLYRLAPVCLLSLLSASPLLAAPAPYSALVVFGDSLSDAGQAPDPNGPANATTRFTNRVGPTYQHGSGEEFGYPSTVLLGEMLGVANNGPSTSPVHAAAGLPDGNNWAVGGYRTDQILASITQPGGSVVGSRSRDGYLVDLASRGLSLDPNTLFYVNGGGNDFLQGRVLNEAQAQEAAVRLADSVRALQAAGARYIMVSLLPNVGRTPALSGTSLADTFGTLGTALNTELLAQLRGIDAEIIPLNVPLLFEEVIRDAARFGFDASQDLVGTCFDGCASQNPTWGIGSATPDPNRLVFNDSVHPTTAVHRIFADYAYSLLAAPWELTLLPEMAHGTLRAHQDRLRAQWQSDWQAWQPVGQWRGFVDAGGQHLDFDDQASASSGNGFGYNLNLGASYRLTEDWRIGLAAGFYSQELEVGAADSDYDLRSYLATAFAQYLHERWWGEAALSAGHLDYHDLRRRFDMGVTTRSEKGDTDGRLWAFGARFGYDIAEVGSDWHLSPFVSADYARVEVDGYAERGDSSSALRYDDQKRTSKRLGVGLQGRLQLSPATALFAELAQEREYEDDTRELRMSLTSLPDIDFQLRGYTPDDRLLRAGFGFSQQLSPGLVLRGSYTYRKADDLEQQGLGLALSLDF